MDRRDRDDLRRFAGWCSTLDIRPDAVDQAVFERYRAELEAHSIQMNPRERWHRARRAWNRTLAAAPSSCTTIDNVAPAGRRSLPWSAFPPRLVAELEAYKADVTASNLFDLDRRKPIKPVTVQGYVSNFRLYVSDLVKDGVKVTELGSLAACIELKRVKRGLKLLLGDRDLDERTTPGLSALMVAILSIAHHVGVGETDLEKLRALHKKVRHVPDGMSERNERRLAQLDEPGFFVRSSICPSRLPNATLMLRRRQSAKRLKCRWRRCLQSFCFSPSALRTLRSSISTGIFGDPSEAVSGAGTSILPRMKLRTARPSTDGSTRS
jgi:hypothetical protein